MLHQWSRNRKSFPDFRRLPQILPLLLPAKTAAASFVWRCCSAEFFRSLKGVKGNSQCPVRRGRPSALLLPLTWPEGYRGGSPDWIFYPKILHAQIKLLAHQDPKAWWITRPLLEEASITVPPPAAIPTCPLTTTISPAWISEKLLIRV